MRVAAVGRAFPDHYYSQEELIAALRRHLAARYHNPARLEDVHRNAQVKGRYLTLPLDAYERLNTFTEANEIYLDTAVRLGGTALLEALEVAQLGPADVDHLFFVSVTGIGVPSVDARLVNRLGLRSDVKRTPIFGLGCAAGAAGLARAADYLRAFPDQVAALVSVELCSLTLQQRDLSIPNLVASGLFGDGAAAVVGIGAERSMPRGAPPAGPRVLATRSVFYPDTERVMGWDVTSDGFRVVLSAAVPQVVEEHLGADVDRFLAEHGLRRADLASYVCHPGGPKVIAAIQKALALDDAALAITWRSLRTLGNLSSASVLLVLGDTLRERRPPPGTLGLLIGMGPGFCSELLLLEW